MGRGIYIMECQGGHNFPEQCQVTKLVSSNCLCKFWLKKEILHTHACRFWRYRSHWRGLFDALMVTVIN